MGNYKFRLSDMMPNAWFYKLKDMSTTSNPSMKMAKKKKKKKKKKNKKYQNQNHGSPSVSVSASASVLPSRTSIDSFLPMAHSCSYSHSFNGHLPRTAFELHSSPVNSPDFPRKSSRIKSKRKTVYRPSPYLLRQKLLSAHWKQPLWTNEDLNSSPPGHYFASPAPPTDGDGYDSSSPDPMEPYSSSDEVAASPPACSNYNRKTIGSSTATTTTDIIIDMNHENSTTPKMKNLKDRGRIKSALEPKLPPLSTRRATSNVNSSADHAALRRASFKLDNFRQHDQPTLHIQVDDGESFQPQNDQKASRHTAQKSPSVMSTGMRLRTNASRVASRKMRAARARKSLSSSIAACVNFTNKNLASSLVITKLSVDPQSDFRDSMEEMIMGHNIRASTDLEDLLTCYLSLNSREYHDHIVRAFEDIWFDVL